MSALVHAYCSEHSASPALDTCTRCGRFTCSDCLLRRQGTVFCVQCVDRLQLPSEDGPVPAGPDDSASTLAFYSLLLVGLGLCLMPFGLLGLVLGAWELFRIRHGHSPSGGRLMARAAIVLGSLITGAWLALLWFLAAGGAEP